MLRTLYLAAAIVAAATTASAQTRPELADLKIVVDNLKPAQGYLMIGVYAGKAAYDTEARVRSERVAVTAGQMDVVVAGLPAGDYGLKLFHDVNGNTRLDSNLLGIPTEPVAFSNNARGAFSPASWTDAHFTVSAPVTVQTIHFQPR